MTGFINVNKSVGASSAKEVAKIKRLLKIPCGHMGTLDPMASGVLPIAVGNACRLFDYFLQKRKSYVSTFRFGEEYDTLDITGNLISDGGRVPSEEEIKKVIPSLLGEIDQMPPKYSAKCVNGKRGYELARGGVEFELTPKRVNIYSIELIGKVDNNSYTFKIECGGGTYIRAIARDIAKQLNTVACMSALIRTASGPFKIENAVTTDNLNQENVLQYIVPCDSLLPFESFRAQGAVAKKIFNGVPAKCDLPDGTYKLYCEDNSFYGLAAASGGLIKVRTKLC